MIWLLWKKKREKITILISSELSFSCSLLHPIFKRKPHLIKVCQPLLLDIFVILEDDMLLGPGQIPQTTYFSNQADIFLFFVCFSFGSQTKHK